MEIFGGFMVMMSIISLFLAVVWLIMPFVVFAIKGKQERMLELLETIDKRLAVLESRPNTGPAATAAEPQEVERSAESSAATRQESAAASTDSLAANI